MVSWNLYILISAKYTEVSFEVILSWMYYWLYEENIKCIGCAHINIQILSLAQWLAKSFIENKKTSSFLLCILFDYVHLIRLRKPCHFKILLQSLDKFIRYLRLFWYLSGICYLRLFPSGRASYQDFSLRFSCLSFISHPGSDIRSWWFCIIYWLNISSTFSEWSFQYHFRK